MLICKLGSQLRKPEPHSEKLWLQMEQSSKMTFYMRKWGRSQEHQDKFKSAFVAINRSNLRAACPGYENLKNCIFTNDVTCSLEITLHSSA